jgi:probable addiction module antidote protein
MLKNMPRRRWNIYEELKTEEDIQAFVEASIVEAENDTDPSLLAHALGVAAKARGMLAVSRDSGLAVNNLDATLEEIWALCKDAPITVDGFLEERRRDK